MGGGERLVQVQVHDVDAEVAGPGLPDQGIHVGAVHVEEAAFLMEDLGDLVNLLFEDAESVGIGEHQAGNIFVHLGGQGADVDHAVRVRLQILHGVAADGGRGRVSSVGRIRNEDF